MFFRGISRFDGANSGKVSGNGTAGQDKGADHFGLESQEIECGKGLDPGAGLIV